MSVKYKRVLLKLSGEALSGDKGFGLDMDTIQTICKGIKDAHDLGAEIAIVVGGGNFWRGRSSGEMERVQTALSMQQIAEPYIRNRAIRHLEKGRVIILACGTGNPFFSTDTASALRAAEINADIIFKATMVDGVYDKDPKKYADAKKYDTLTFSRVLADQLAVMDSTAATMCRDNSLPILVFDILHPENIAKAVAGEPIGTLVVEQ